MGSQWSTLALGSEGKVYKIMLFTLPVIPAAMIVFTWYVLYAGNNFPPIPIVVFVVCVLLVFIHQILEVINFLRAARITAKNIYIKEKKIFLQLFSGKTVELSPIAYVEDIGKFKVKPDSKLFIKDMRHLALIDGDDVFYISGTTERFDELCEKLKELEKY